MKVADFCARISELHTYLHGGVVEISGHPSRLQWLDRAHQPHVPIDIAASGPKVIAFASRSVERVTLAVGADHERVRWAIELARAAIRDEGRAADDVSLGAYVNVGCHPDPNVGRELIRGSIAAFAHFSAMPGSTGAGLDDRDREVVAEVGRTYDSNLHLRNSAEHARGMDARFIDRFGVVGDVDTCTNRLVDLVSLGLERLVITGPTIDADRAEARISTRMLRDEVLPALRLAATADVASG
jgi:5,10-methylenetetrahydromethanopterin reductase